LLKDERDNIMPKYMAGDWVKTSDGDVARVRLASVDDAGVIDYLIDPSDGSWFLEKDLSPVQHELALGTVVHITTPTRVSGPMGDREERDDTLYVVTSARHFGEGGEPMYALSHMAFGELFQSAVVGEQHLAAVEGMPPLSPDVVGNTEVVGLSHGVMTEH
jgi:hypothetical protein